MWQKTEALQFKLNYLFLHTTFYYNVTKDSIKLPTISFACLECVCINVCVLAFVCVNDAGTYMSRCTCMCQRITSGISLHHPPFLRQGLLVVWARSAGLWASRGRPGCAFCPPIGTLGLRILTLCLLPLHGFWALRLRLSDFHGKCVYSLSCLPRPCYIFWT